LPLRDNGQIKTGIGIHNVRQRLDLLYKDKYDLQIREEEEVFVVDLKVELIRKKKQEEADNSVKMQPAVEYNLPGGTSIPNAVI